MSRQEEKIWNQIKTNDSWAIFKIMGEFVEGYERMAKIGPCVSIFGSARTPENNAYYQLGKNIAERLSNEGFGIITGVALELWRQPTKERKKAKEFQSASISNFLSNNIQIDSSTKTRI